MATDTSRSTPMTSEPPFTSDDVPYGFHVTGEEDDPIPTPSSEPPFICAAEGCDRTTSERATARLLPDRVRSIKYWCPEHNPFDDWVCPDA
jgi:hypothetical protein